MLTHALAHTPTGRPLASMWVCYTLAELLTLEAPVTGPAWSRSRPLKEDGLALRQLEAYAFFVSHLNRLGALV